MHLAYIEGPTRKAGEPASEEAGSDLRFGGRAGEIRTPDF